MLRLALAALLLSAVSAAAEPQMPEWIRFSLTVEGPIREIYKNSIAQRIYLKTKKPAHGILPPIQYISRPAEGELQADSRNAAREVLQSLGVDTEAKSTVMLKGAAFKAGTERELPGYLMEFQSSEDGESYLTCIAVVKRGKTLHTLFVQAFQSSLSDCPQHLVGLSRNPILFEDKPIDGVKTGSYKASHEKPSWP